MTMVLCGARKTKGKKQTFLDAIHKKVIQYGNNVKNATFLRELLHFT